MLFDLLAMRAGATATHPLFQQRSLPSQALLIEVWPPTPAASARAELRNGLLLPIDELTLVDTGEQWKSVADFPGYRVSSHGHIVSLAYRGRPRQRLLLPLNALKYPEVRLSNGTRVLRIGLNRLVAQEFLPPPTQPHHDVIIPLDGNRFNLRADNMRWAGYCDVTDPAAWAYLHGCQTRRAAGKLSPAAKASIKELAGRGVTKQAIARQFGVSRPTISLLLTRDARTAR